jgi:two-component system, NarL family, nitrate/nitrite response regulator NarL
MDGVHKQGGVCTDQLEPTGQTADHRGAGDDAARHQILILSDIRFLRESLATVLARDGMFAVAGVAARVGDAVAAVATRPPPIVLIDAALPDGLTAVALLRRVAPAAQIIALALSEVEAEIIAWAEAGVCGYLPRGTGLTEFTDELGRVIRHEQVCSTRVAAGLLRRIADGPRASTPADTAAALTAREVQVVHLVASGLSNKEIARQLAIGLATVKSHVHNVLSKLALKRRSQLARWVRAHEWTPGGRLLQTPTRP